MLECSVTLPGTCLWCHKHIMKQEVDQCSLALLHDKIQEKYNYIWLKSRLKQMCLEACFKSTNRCTTCKTDWQTTPQSPGSSNEQMDFRAQSVITKIYGYGLSYTLFCKTPSLLYLYHHSIVGNDWLSNCKFTMIHCLIPIMFASYLCLLACIRQLLLQVSDKLRYHSSIILAYS